ncbi:MAG: hypothetical protein A2173_06925 [Planctomycetes bacterium RBG_13_44_8b]|nr:MAG: hypothetical protein A2173_06925 [Planctomycetes bacterium RBG_13_44_8b]
MTLRVDKRVLLQAFAKIEAIIVGIPMIIYIMVLGCILLAGLFNFEIEFLPICFIVLFIGSFYLIPHALIAQNHISVASPLPVLMPEGLFGWLAVIVFYSVVSLIIALIVSLYIPNKRNT